MPNVLKVLRAAAVERTGLGKAESAEALAAGIKVALYTTIFGLGVAIPATLLAGHLQARVRKLTLAVAAAIAPAVEALGEKPRGAAVTPAAGSGEGEHHAA